eukprot:3542733-Amphidinium_carterae.1
MATAAVWSSDDPLCSTECGQFYELGIQTSLLQTINLVDLFMCYFTVFLFFPCIPCFHTLKGYASSHAMPESTTRFFVVWFAILLCCHVADIVLCAWALAISSGPLSGTVEEVLRNRCVNEEGNFALKELEGSLQSLRINGVVELAAGILGAMLDCILLGQMGWISGEVALSTFQVASIGSQVCIEVVLELVEVVSASLDYFVFTAVAISKAEIIQQALLTNTTVEGVQWCVVPTEIRSVCPIDVASFAAPMVAASQWAWLVVLAALVVVLY